MIASKEKKKSRLNGLESVSKGAESAIGMTIPYVVKITIKGTCPMLFHRWNCEAVEEKAKAKRNSEIKKTDNIESYVYRDSKGYICLPGTYLKGAMMIAAKRWNDPGSARKTAHDLFKGSVIPLTELASLGIKEWDYVDQRRVTIIRSGITRKRPAINEDWEAEIDFLIQTPDLIPPAFLQEVCAAAGLLVGVGDYRPTYGRFRIIGFEVK